MRLQVVCGGHSLRFSAVHYGDVGFSHSLHNLYAHDYDVERPMLENFTHYTSINSQPSFDSISTAGQHNVAMDIRSDAMDSVDFHNAESATSQVNDEDYVYVNIPANITKDA